MASTGLLDVNSRNDVDFYIDRILRSDSAEEPLIEILVKKLRTTESQHKAELVNYAYEHFKGMSRHHSHEHGSGTTPIEKNVQRAASMLSELRKGNKY